MVVVNKSKKPYVDPGWPELDDGEIAVTELSSANAGGLSPFGDTEFPVPIEDLRYAHPHTVITADTDTREGPTPTRMVRGPSRATNYRADRLLRQVLGEEPGDRGVDLHTGILHAVVGVEQTLRDRSAVVLDGGNGVVDCLERIRARVGDRRR